MGSASFFVRNNRFAARIAKRLMRTKRFAARIAKRAMRAAKRLMRAAKRLFRTKRFAARKENDGFWGGKREICDIESKK